MDLPQQIASAQQSSRVLLRMGWALLALLLQLLLGTLGFLYFGPAGTDPFDAFYMTAITITTVGYGEVVDLRHTDAGRLFAALVSFIGFGTVTFIFTSLSVFFLETDLNEALRRRRMEKAILKLKNHYIVCGYGRIGGVVVQEIMKVTPDVVVIETDPHLVEKLKLEGIMHLSGDATDDGLLVAAGIKRAKSIVTALTDEAANVYVTLTARQLNPAISIIARANNASHITRLEFAGANKVVLPHLIGGVRMAHSVLRPTVTDFLDLAVRGHIDLQLEQLDITAKSPLVGKNLMESNIRKEFDLIIVAIKRASGELVFNPGPREILESGDTLITLGRQNDLQRICELL